MNILNKMFGVNIHKISKNQINVVVDRRREKTIVCQKRRFDKHKF